MKDSMNKYGLLGPNNNQMTTLLNRIERQLGLSIMPLPDGLKKNDWAAIIAEDTIPVFSQYFPYSIVDIITPDQKKDDYFFIDQHLPDGARILGVKDIDWFSYRADSRFDRYGINIPTQEWLSRDYALSDVALTAVGNDMMSLFDLGIYPEFEYPNKIRLVSVNGTFISQYRPFPLRIFLEHPSLMTISPTMMEQFTKLAKADIALAIYNVLKYYDNMDTSFAQLSLQLDVLQDWANKRDDIIRELDEAHVNASNEYQSLIMTV